MISELIRRCGWCGYNSICNVVGAVLIMSAFLPIRQAFGQKNIFDESGRAPATQPAGPNPPVGQNPNNAAGSAPAPPVPNRPGNPALPPARPAAPGQGTVKLPERYSNDLGLNIAPIILVGVVPPTIERTVSLQPGAPGVVPNQPGWVATPTVGAGVPAQAPKRDEMRSGPLCEVWLCPAGQPPRLVSISAGEKINKLDAYNATVGPLSARLSGWVQIDQEMIVPIACPISMPGTIQKQLTVNGQLLMDLTPKSEAARHRLNVKFQPGFHEIRLEVKKASGVNITDDLDLNWCDGVSWHSLLGTNAWHSPIESTQPMAPPANLAGPEGLLVEEYWGDFQQLKGSKSFITGAMIAPLLAVKAKQAIPGSARASGWIDVTQDGGYVITVTGDANWDLRIDGKPIALTKPRISSMESQLQAVVTLRHGLRFLDLKANQFKTNGVVDLGRFDLQMKMVPQAAPPQTTYVPGTFRWPVKSLSIKTLTGADATAAKGQILAAQAALDAISTRQQPLPPDPPLRTERELEAGLDQGLVVEIRSRNRAETAGLSWISGQGQITAAPFSPKLTAGITPTQIGTQTIKAIEGATIRASGWLRIIRPTSFAFGFGKGVDADIWVGGKQVYGLQNGVAKASEMSLVPGYYRVEIEYRRFVEAQGIELKTAPFIFSSVVRPQTCDGAFFVHGAVAAGAAPVPVRGDPAELSPNIRRPPSVAKAPPAKAPQHQGSDLPPGLRYALGPSSVAARQSSPQARGVVPSADEIAAARVALVNRLKPETTIEGRRRATEAANALLRDPNSPPAEVYVILRNGFDAACSANSIPDIMLRAAKLSERFAVDEIELLMTTLQNLAAKPPPEGDASFPKSMSLALAGLFDRLCLEDRWDRAVSVADLAAAYAKKYDPCRSPRLQAVATVAHEALTDWPSIKSAGDQLRANPSDNAAQLAIGLHKLFHHPSAEGLQMLEACPDVELKTLAQLEMLTPSDSVKRLAIADGWWLHSPALKGSNAVAARRRAANWYQAALNAGLDGPNKARAVERSRFALWTVDLLGGIGVAPDSGKNARRVRELSMIPQADPSGISPSEKVEKVACQPPGEYDLQVEVTLFQERSYISLEVPTDVGIREQFKANAAASISGKSQTPNLKTNIGRRNQLLIQVRRSSIRFYVDGQLVRESPGASPSRKPWDWSGREPSYIVFSVGSGAATIHSAMLTDLGD